MQVLRLLLVIRFLLAIFIATAQRVVSIAQACAPVKIGLRKSDRKA